MLSGPFARGARHFEAPRMKSIPKCFQDGYPSPQERATTCPDPYAGTYTTSRLLDSIPAVTKSSMQIVPTICYYTGSGATAKIDPTCWPPSLKGFLRPLERFSTYYKNKQVDRPELLVNDTFLLAYGELNEESRVIVTEAILAAPIINVKVQTRFHMRGPFDPSYILIRLIMSSLRVTPW